MLHNRNCIRASLVLVIGMLPAHVKSVTVTVKVQMPGLLYPSTISEVTVTVLLAGIVIGFGVVVPPINS